VTPREHAEVALVALNARNTIAPATFSVEVTRACEASARDALMGVLEMLRAMAANAAGGDGREWLNTAAGFVEQTVNGETAK
jgi:hypothetical protein